VTGQIHPPPRWNRVGGLATRAAPYWATLPRPPRRRPHTRLLVFCFYCLSSLLFCIGLKTIVAVLSKGLPGSMCPGQRTAYRAGTLVGPSIGSSSRLRRGRSMPGSVGASCSWVVLHRPSVQRPASHRFSRNPVHRRGPLRTRSFKRRTCVGLVRWRVRSRSTAKPGCGSFEVLTCDLVQFGFGLFELGLRGLAFGHPRRLLGRRLVPALDEFVWGHLQPINFDPEAFPVPPVSSPWVTASPPHGDSATLGHPGVP